MKRVMMIAALAAILGGPRPVAAEEAGAPYVTNTIARQRYPWNGLVDITCKVTGSDSETNGLKFAVSAVMPDTGYARNVSHFWVVQGGTNLVDREVHTNGSYRLLWDARADLGIVRYTNMVVRVNFDAHEKVQLWEDGPYWATTNIGAEKPEDYGYYFWWGDTVGYTRSGGTWTSDYYYSGVTWVSSMGEQMGSSPFSPSSCPTHNKSISTLQSEGWIVSQDGTYVLAPEHDAAQVQWGGGWRMPTDAEFLALISNCTTTWTTRNGVYGRLVTGKGAYADRSIFLPAAGYGNASCLNYPGSYGLYPSSTPDSGTSDSGNYVWGLSFKSGGFYHSSGFRFYGKSVRPVQGFTK
jgi:hypothetical protein